jgi:hypothetical protein
VRKSKMNQKSELTKYIIKCLGLPDDTKTFKRLYATFWVNPRQKPKGGLKLTETGFKTFEQHIKSYRVDLEERNPTFDNNQILWLDKYIDCPFYIDRKSVYVFSERMAIQLVLFSGNLVKFGHAKDKSSKKATDKNAVL